MQGGNINMITGKYIYLKGDTDVNNYIKYDYINDGIQICGNSSITFKDISNNIYFKCTPSLLYMNTNLSISGSSFFNNLITANNGIINYNNSINNYSYLNQTNNIYMTNASSIYLKSSTDLYNNIKYDLINDGISFCSNSINFKDINGNTFFRSTPSLLYMNTNLSISGSSIFTGYVVCNNGITNNNGGIVNNSTFSNKGVATFQNTTNTNGIVNNTFGITNNGSLLQVAGSTFTGKITSNGGITNSVIPIINNSSLTQFGGATFYNLMSISGIINYNYPIYNYSSVNQKGQSTFFNPLLCISGIISSNIQTNDNIYVASNKSVYVTDQAMTGGITNSVIPIINNSSLTQFGGATFYNLMSISGIINYNYPIYNYSSVNQKGQSTFFNPLLCISGIISSNIQTNDNIYVASNKSVYVTDQAMTNYLRMHNNGSDSFFDYTGKLYIRQSGSTWVLKVDTTYQIYLYYTLNTNGI